MAFTPASSSSSLVAPLGPRSWRSALALVGGSLGLTLGVVAQVLRLRSLRALRPPEQPCDELERGGRVESTDHVRVTAGRDDEDDRITPQPALGGEELVSGSPEVSSSAPAASAALGPSTSEAEAEAREPLPPVAASRPSRPPQPRPEGVSSCELTALKDARASVRHVRIENVAGGSSGAGRFQLCGVAFFASLVHYCLTLLVCFAETVVDVPGTKRSHFAASHTMFTSIRGFAIFTGETWGSKVGKRLDARWRHERQCSFGSGHPTIAVLTQPPRSERAGVRFQSTPRDSNSSIPRGSGTRQFGSGGSLGANHRRADRPSFDGDHRLPRYGGSVSSSTSRGKAPTTAKQQGDVPLRDGRDSVGVVGVDSDVHDAGGRRGRLASVGDEVPQAVSVCVRVRPMSSMESAEGQSKVVHVELDKPGGLSLTSPQKRHRRVEPFLFDTVLPDSAGQSDVYRMLGEPVVMGVADGYHGCIFAYGQTGSGKSHTMFGGPDEARGLIPRIAEGLFQELGSKVAGQNIVKVSYLELYNEQARDLLNPSVGEAANQALVVREHPQVGVFVEGLTRSAVSSAEDLLRLVDFGHKIRVVGCTNMNASSSRSHAVVTIHVEQVLPSSSGQKVRRHAQLHAVDLAGSERMKNAGENAMRQAESKKINVSLLALGQIIQKLASRGAKRGSSAVHIPYRDSKLTFLLSQSLMGNCRTAMLACVSPASGNQNLTDSTLRFAASVMKIHTRPVRNEEIQGDLVRTLHAQVEALRRQLEESAQSHDSRRELEDQLQSEHWLQDQLSASWEEQQARSRADDTQRRKTLKSLGLAASWSGEAEANYPYVVNVCDDPLLSGRLTYKLTPGEKPLRVGSDPSCEVRVDGLGAEPELCTLQCRDSRTVEISVSALLLSGSPMSEDILGSTLGRRRPSLRKGSLFGERAPMVTVNGLPLQGTKQLVHGDMIRAGRTKCFQVVIPEAAGHGKDDDASFLEECLAAEGAGTFGKEFLAHLREHFGLERTKRVFRKLKDLRALVDEANDITDDLRGGESHELIFKEQVLMDASSKEEDPAIVVTLSRTERPDEVSQDGPVFGDERGRSELMAVWTFSHFRHRLEVMRDLYEEISARDVPWGQSGDLDPWQEEQTVPILDIGCEGNGTWPSLAEVLFPGALTENGALAQSSSAPPFAFQADEPELQSTTETRPLHADPGSLEKLADPGAVERRREMTMLLQTMPRLEEELAKAVATRERQNKELLSVRRELEEMKALYRPSSPRGPPVRRAGGDAASPPFAAPGSGASTPRASEPRASASGQAAHSAAHSASASAAPSAPASGLESSSPEQALSALRLKSPRRSSGTKVQWAPAGWSALAQSPRSRPASAKAQGAKGSRGRASSASAPEVAVWLSAPRRIEDVVAPDADPKEAPGLSSSLLAEEGEILMREDSSSSSPSFFASLLSAGASCDGVIRSTEHWRGASHEHLPCFVNLFDRNFAARPIIMQARFRVMCEWLLQLRLKAEQNFYW
ncbi:unnamed protein product [Polarella glacialis]|uniref:Kinesin motor domain-containing protein n=1 Tax=Polarella glacialis TaxID=89957 RepID=A0A813FCM8_POLGL|nr:unnamed protein product [Polarella glacialis]